MSDIKEVMDSVKGVNEAFQEFKASNDLRLKELESKGASDPLLDEKMARISDAMDEHQKRLDAYELAQKRETRTVTDAKGNEVDLDARAFAWADWNAKRRGTAIEYGAFGEAERRAYKKSFASFLRRGDEVMGPDEKRDMLVGPDPDGGYLVEPDMNGRIVEQIYETSPLRMYAAVQMISSDALEGLRDTDEVDSGWVNERDQRAETGTPTLGKWRIPVQEVYAKPHATQRLLDDAMIDVEMWLAEKIADKFSREENKAFVSGESSAEPKGFLTYPHGTSNAGQIERVPSGADGGFKAAPDGGDVLFDALYSLKDGYRMNAVFAMNRSTLREVRKLKDGDGAYLWVPGIAAGQPSMLCGYPVAGFEDMPAVSAGSLSIAVADWRRAYQIVDRMGIRTLRDPYSAKPYVQFYCTKRTGGDVLNFEAIKLVEFSTAIG